MAVRRVLVTGAYGLIGSIVYSHLLVRPEQYEVYALARRRHPSERFPADRDLRVPDERFILSDLSDLEVLVRALQGIEVVVHMAADPRLEAPWESVLASNVIGARNVFEAARLAGVRRVVYASSLTYHWGYLMHEAPYNLIYEGRYDELSPDDVPKVRHDWPPRPISYYPASKVWGEALARVYADTHGLSVICLRFGAVNGDDRPQAEKWARSVWCSQRDAIQAVERAILAPDEMRFDVFHVVSDNKWCWVDLGHSREVLGYVPQDSAEERMAGDTA
jgi:nucleoside-diphosphate-sugar epimerase